MRAGVAKAHERGAHSPAQADTIPRIALHLPPHCNTMQGVLHPSDIDDAHLGTLAKLPRKQVRWAAHLTIGAAHVFAALRATTTTTTTTHNIQLHYVGCARKIKHGRTRYVPT